MGESPSSAERHFPFGGRGRCGSVLPALFDARPLECGARPAYCREFAVRDSSLRIETYETDGSRIRLHYHLNLH